MSAVSFPDRAMKVARIDLSAQHPMPSLVRGVTGTVLSVVISLLADALIVFIGSRVFPSTAGNPHFRFSDYATLTTIGVVIAGAAWPFVVHISSAPRWLYLRLAIVVTLVLWLPNLYLVLRGQPVRAVAALMTMHLVIAVVTYNLMVRIAPADHDIVPEPELTDSRPDGTGVPRPVDEEREGSDLEKGDPARRLAGALALLVGVEFVLGIVALVLVPTGRPTGWLPNEGKAIYLAHALVGLPLALAAVVYLVTVRESTRIYRLSGWIGCSGVLVAGTGGLLTVAHPVRLVGMAFMFVGPLVAGFGFLLPVFDMLSEGVTPLEDS
jgi:hypothetical protein